MRSCFYIVMAISAGVVPACGNSNGKSRGTTTTLTSLQVMPPSAAVAVTDGPASPVAFSTVGQFSDGHTEVLADAVFTLDSAAQHLGTLNANQFVASGQSAGQGQLVVQAQGLTAKAAIGVTVQRSHVGVGVPSSGAGEFTGATTSTGPNSPHIDYPLDGAIMPSSVRPPDIQWEGPQVAGDLYRVTATSGGASVQSILAVATGFTFDAPLSADDWSLLTQSGTTIEIAVDHWDATSGVQTGSPVNIHVPAADVRGVVYYWDLSQGVIQKLDDSGRKAAIPNPPASPTDGNRCVACHVISRDGRYMAGELWGGSQSGAVFDLTNSLVASANPAPTLAPVNSYVSLFSTFNADASRLLINPGTALQLIDPKVGSSLMTQGAPLPSAKAAHPTWSPDGTLIAFVNNIDGTWAVDYTTGDLQLIDASAGDTFGAPRPLVTNSTGDPAFKAPSWPTFTPDSQWIAYGAGTNSRGRNSVTTNGVATEVTYPGALFMVNRAGGAPTRLDNACSTMRDCYLPNFSPFDSGDYVWLVFYSLRDYGNAQAGTKGSGRRQMWVTAIDKSKLGTADASSVPYWLPGQDPATENMSAFWAVSPPIQ